MSTTPNWMLGDPRRSASLFDAVDLAVDVRPKPVLVATADLDQDRLVDMCAEDIRTNLPRHLKAWQRAMDVEGWNRPETRDPITATEYNWVEDGQWRRSYGNFNDGVHRSLRACLDSVPEV